MIGEEAHHAKARLSRWQAAFVVARRDFTAILFSKSFLFFLLGPLVMIAISGVAGVLSAKAVENAEPPRLAVAMAPADSAAFAQARDALDPLLDLPVIVVVPPDSAHASDALLSDDEGNFGAVLDGTLADPHLTGTQGQIDSWKGEVALVAAKASGKEAANYPEVALSPTLATGASTKRYNAATATGSVTLLFLLTMFLAGMVMSNLVEEKGNKIIEILAAAIPMDAVFFGKLFAMLAVSFVGIAVWGAVAGAILLGAGAAPEAGVIANLAPPAVGWPAFVALFLVYFAMAYLLIGSIYLTIGSIAPTVRDVQTLSMPATMGQLILFFFANYAITQTGRLPELFAIAFPLTSPYAMIARAAQEPSLWPHAAALAWQVLCVALFIRGGSRLFRRRVMKSGPPGAKAKRGLFRKAAPQQADHAPQQ